MTRQISAQASVCELCQLSPQSSALSPFILARSVPARVRGLEMDSTPSNGSGVRARSRKANTSPAQAPNGRPPAKAAARQRATAPTRQRHLPAFDTYPAIAIEDVQPELDGRQWP